jgi:coproporphyrinogen III oxidase-like Fe-S oxidoreductase
LNKKDKLINIDLNISFLSNKKLLTIKKYCSRVSIWIQTFNKKLLLESNRFFDKENFYNSYFRYFNINWIKINVDLMIWLKNQTLEDIDYTIKKIIFLKVDNVSLNYFHKKDWLKYDFDEKWIELIIETKSKWDKIIIKYNLSQNKQLDIESRKNNIIWIWVWAVGNIFGKVWFYRYNFDNYFNKIDNGILWFDKYIIIDTYLETVSYFLEKIFCRVKKIEIINIYWNKNLDKIKTKLNKLFINWFLKEDNEHIYSTVSDREIFPILVESLLGKYIKNWYFWNLTDNYSESENVYENYNFFFDHSGTYIDQLE